MKEDRKNIEETGITPKHKPISDIGAGRQMDDDLSGTLSDRAGDEGFDDDTVIRIKGETTAEELDDL